MAGKTKRAARDNFVQPLQRALSCVTQAQLYYGGPDRANELQALAVSENPIRLPRRSGPALWLSLQHQFVVVRTEDPRRGPWKVSSRAYRYRLDDGKRSELASWHWHPLGTSKQTRPHLHVPRAPLPAGHHLPTGRVSIESILRLVLAELDVRPQRDDWAGVLDQTEGPFEEYRTWA